MNGKELKTLIQSKRIRQYEVARELNVNEFTFSRWLREELDEERKTEILEAIKNVSENINTIEGEDTKCK